MLFKILKGDSSRISTDITPLHSGWCYFTRDEGGFYIDSEDESGENVTRTRINPTSREKYGTLSKGGWRNGQQRLIVPGLKENQNGLLGVSHDITDEQLDAVKRAGIYIYEQLDNALIVAASGDIPQCDIPVITVLLV